MHVREKKKETQVEVRIDERGDVKGEVKMQYQQTERAKVTMHELGAAENK